MQSQAFTLVAPTTIVCPGSYLTAAGQIVLATGIIHSITMERNDASSTQSFVEVFDAYDANGLPFRSTGLTKRGIALTGATAMRQSVFECRGSAITGGPTLSTYNRKLLFDVPPKLNSLGDNVGGQVSVETRIVCTAGMIIQVTGHAASDVLSVTYQPLTLGKAFHRRAVHQIPTY